MLGHTPNKLTRAYRRPPEEAYKEAYIEGLDSITTDKINILDFRSPEIQEIKNENLELKADLEQIKTKLAGLGDFAKVMDNPEVKKVMEEISKSK